MSTLSKFMIFASGAAIGSVITWKLIKTKYEQRAQEEIEFAVDRLEKKYNKEDHSGDVPVPGSNEKPSIKEYEAMLKELNYSRESEYDDSYKKNNKEKEVDNEMKDIPYVISPEEFDDHEDYEVETLTYYADGVLTDWYDEPIDVDEYVGQESLTRFGEYEKDTVYVRNDNHRCDYEIQRDTRNYSDVYPHRQED